MKVLGLQELSIVLPVRFYLKDVTGWWQGSVLNIAFFLFVPNHRPKNKLLVKLHSGEFCWILARCSLSLLCSMYCVLPVMIGSNWGLSWSWRYVKICVKWDAPDLLNISGGVYLIMLHWKSATCWSCTLNIPFLPCWSMHQSTFMKVAIKFELVCGFSCVIECFLDWCWGICRFEVPCSCETSNLLSDYTEELILGNVIGC